VPVHETFERRTQRERGETVDAYQYDMVPAPLRAQTKMILTDLIGQSYQPRDPYGTNRVPPHNNEAWSNIGNEFCREIGEDRLAGVRNIYREICRWLADEEEVKRWLSLVQIALSYADRFMRTFNDHRRGQVGARLSAQGGIDEFNQRCQLAAFGYQYEGSKIIRIDSQLAHAEMTVPALRLLSDPRFAGADEEFRNAHAHYRRGEMEDAVVDAGNAFESTMKAICDARGWPCNAGARASDLIKVVRANELLPGYLDKSFDQLVATLISGLPQVRNNEGSHGQGATPRQTPTYVAGYALHLVAAKIILLVEAFHALPDD
jgi:hypothetical protein